MEGEMSKTRILGASAAGLVVLAALSGLAIANDAARSASDAPKAGCPAAKAASDGAVKKFGAADTDEDGALSRAEVEGKLPAIAEAFDSLDLDGDGKLTSFEIHHGSGAAGYHGRHPVRPAAFQTQTLRL
jgi:hypothetical protein